MTFQRLLAVFILMPSFALSQPFCHDVNQLLGDAASNFPTDPNRPTLSADRCTTALSSLGAHSYHCSWEFAYRDPSATKSFEKIKQSLETCLKTSAQSEELGVNHPDSFDLVQYDLERAVVTLSLKDKGALQHSYVFIGIHKAK